MRPVSTRRTKVIAIVAASVSVFVVLLFAPRLFVRTYRVPTLAMVPAIPQGAHIVVRLTTAAGRGDIVAFRYPRDPQTAFAKRIVAVGGDLVEIRAKSLFVNGDRVEEPYVVHADEQIYPRGDYLPEPYRSRDHFGPYRVQPDHVFVLGDNRDHSSDSRYWGSVPRRNIIGKVVLLYHADRGYSRPDAGAP